jgi:hypothetical protein
MSGRRSARGLDEVGAGGSLNLAPLETTQRNDRKAIGGYNPGPFVGLSQFAAPSQLHEMIEIQRAYEKRCRRFQMLDDGSNCIGRISNVYGLTIDFDKDRRT